MSSLETEEERQFRTFANYLASVELLLEVEHTSCEGLVSSLRSAMQPQRKLATGVNLDDVLNLLKRAWATEALMNLPFKLDAMKDIVPQAVLWLPVQTYYAVFSALDAALRSHGHIVDTHSKALRSYATQLRGQMPFPLNCACVGPDDSYVYENFRCNPDKNFSTLKRPQSVDDAQHLLGTALRSTRRHLLDDRCDDWKRKAKKKRILAAQRKQIGTLEAATSLLHFLYRLRLRSNYGDSDVFVSGSTARESIAFARAYVNVTSYFLGSLECLIEKRLGTGYIGSAIKQLNRNPGTLRPVENRWTLQT